MKHLWLALSILMTSSLTAQVVNADSLYAVSRDLAQDKRYDEARVLLNQVLEAYPDYHDVRNYLGRTYAWDERYNEAEAAFNTTLNKDDSNPDAWLGLVDVYLWQELYPETDSVIMVAKVSMMNADSLKWNDLIVREAEVRFRQRDYHRALDILETTFGERSNRLKQNVLLRLINNSVDVFGSAEYFSSTFDPMYYGGVQVGQNTKHGIGIARVNVANRFNQTGYQGEIDLYPRISDNMYGYVNYGYSPSTDVFPEHRLGAELYYGFDNGLELSAGMRYLYFGETSTVTMYTGSVSYYMGKYWVSLRPFITPQEDGTDVTGNLILRRYLGNPRNWLTLRLNYGFSPDARRIQVGAGETIEILESSQASLEWQQAFSQNWMFILGFTYTQQEIPFNPGNYYSIYAPNIGIKRLL